MNRKLFVTIFALTVMLLASFAVKTSLVQSPRQAPAENALSDYWQRHPAEVIPVTGTSLRGARTADLTDFAARHPGMSIVASGALAADLTDYAARHPGMSIVASNAPAVDLTDYAARHPGMSIVASNTPAVDLTDYAARHPGMRLTSTRKVDTTDYYFRHLSND